MQDCVVGLDAKSHMDMGRCERGCGQAADHGAADKAGDRVMGADKSQGNRNTPGFIGDRLH